MPVKSALMFFVCSASAAKHSYDKTRESLPKGCFLKMIIDLSDVKTVFSAKTAVDKSELSIGCIFCT